MPPIQSQALVTSPDNTTATITIVSSTDGTIVTTGVKAGSTVTMEMRKNGALVSGVGVSNPQAIGTATQSDIENWINRTFLAIGANFQLASHVISLVPLSVNVICYNAGLTAPANWWVG